jgi:hypothetical protein
MPTGIIKKISVEQRWQVLWHIKKIPTTKKKYYPLRLCPDEK